MDHPGETPSRYHLDSRAGDLLEKGLDGDRDDLLNTTALAEWFGVSEAWVCVARSRGGGPPFIRLAPRHVRYKRSDVLRWLAERTRSCTRDGRPK